MLLLEVVIAGALVLGSGHGPARAAEAGSTVTATSAASARTQDPPTPPTPPVLPTPRRAPAPQVPPTLPTPPAPPAAPVPPAPPAKPGQNVNMQIELTITETSGTTPETKIVSMLAADASWGRVRSQGSARPNATAGFDAVVLNVDARPTILNADSLRLELTVEYVPPMDEVSSTADTQRPARLHQSLNVILKNGQSLQVSRAVDPVSKRTTTVDVKATRLP